LNGLISYTHSRADEAEESFQMSVQVSRQQSARLWELRAAMSLARLWRGQGKQEAAEEVLASVYEWFTEGFDTPDLKRAESLLKDLRAQR
jgi:predicted ATPase